MPDIVPEVVHEIPRLIELPHQVPVSPFCYDALAADAIATRENPITLGNELLTGLLVERQLARSIADVPPVGTRQQCGKDRCKGEAVWKATPIFTGKRLPVIHACVKHLLPMLHGMYQYRIDYL